MSESQWKFRKFEGLVHLVSEGLARCRSCHAFTVTFEIAVNSQMQTSNISIKIVMKNYTQNIYCNVLLKKCKFFDTYRMKFGFQICTKTLLFK